MRLVAGAIGALLVASTIAPAIAQPAPPADPAQETPEKRRARALLKEGVRLLKLNQHADALGLFEDAYTAFPSPNILINMALAYTGLGKRVDAANTYQRFLDAPDRDATKVAGVEADLRALDAQVGRVRYAVTGATGTIEVRLDGGDWGPPPTSVWRVEPGAHKAEARAGKLTTQTDVDVAAGSVVEIALDLAPKPAPIETPSTVTPQLVATKPVEPTVEVEAPEAAKEPGRIGAQLQLLVQAGGKGAAGAIGATVTAHPRVRIAAGGIVGPTTGGFAAATFSLTTGTVRPTLTGGIPVMLADGVHVGMRGAAGLEWAMSKRASLVADVAAEYYPSPGTFYKSVMLLPTFGVLGRL